MSGGESLFRSAAMSLIQLYIPVEGAHATVTELGELGNVQFKDLNPDVTPFQRAYVAQIRNLDELERRVQFLTTQLEREAIPARPLESAIPFVSMQHGHLSETERGPALLDELGSRLREHEERVAQMNSSHEALQRRLQELEEAKYVIRETSVFFQHAEETPEQVRLSICLLYTSPSPRDRG